MGPTAPREVESHGSPFGLEGRPIPPLNHVDAWLGGMPFEAIYSQGEGGDPCESDPRARDPFDWENSPQGIFAKDEEGHAPPPYP